jgi:hypothetical protein
MANLIDGTLGYYCLTTQEQQNNAAKKDAALRSTARAGTNQPRRRRHVRGSETAMEDQ